jgi:hypothetical protein
VMAFYIMYKLNFNESVQTTYAEGIMLKAIQRFQNGPTDINYKAEFSLLNNIINGIPKVGSKKIKDFIEEAENGNEKVPQLQDINQYLKQYQEKVPNLNGPEQFSVPGTLRDYEDDEVSPPLNGIKAAEISEEEFDTRHFNPNFLRPFPIEDLEDDEEEFKELEALWLVPGPIPEPYWDYQMGLSFNFAEFKKIIKKAHKMALTPQETSLA